MAALARVESAGRRPDDYVRAATQRFDVETVFKLSVCSRSLPAISGLDRCINLTDLNLSNNCISKIEGLDTVVQLKKLNLSSNRISRIEGIWHMSKLECLQLQDNRLESLPGLSLQQVAQLPALKTLYLQNVDRSSQNPVCKQPGYKQAVLAVLGEKLTNLDGERNPTTLNYAELAEEMDDLVANPPPPREVVLPPVAPWLEGQATDLGPVAPDPAVESKVQALTALLEASQELVLTLGQETVRFARQVEEQVVAKQGQQAKA